MSIWLSYATELIGVKSSSALADKFVDNIIEELGLLNAMFLIPTSDGRLVIPHDNRSGYSWSVTDFDAPFAHVIQSENKMCLMAEELIFWQSNRTFNQLVADVGMFGSVWLQPLKIGGGHTKHILLLVGDHSALNKAFKQSEFSKFVDVFTKQWELLNSIEREEESRRLLKESLYDIERDSLHHTQEATLANQLIGRSSVMQKLRKQIVSAAESHLSVIVQGDTGTGKELAAQAIHDFSPRKHEPFIAINCAAIPDNLLESELFGYCKGAFSGADSDKQGLIAQANGGTLFLDEIGDMPLALQAKLLRVLESRSFRPIGGKEEQSSDFRLVSATHVNLLEQVRLKNFRQDLYYRLFQYPISLPNLSSRREDIEQLSQHFIDLYNKAHGKNIRGIHYKALDRLKQHAFPGNIRELKHLIEFGCAQTLDGNQIEEECLKARIVTRSLQPMNRNQFDGYEDDVQSTVNGFQHDLSTIGDLRVALNDYEKKIIQQRLDLYGGDRAKAAQSLSVPKRTLAYKCHKLDIK